MQNIRGTCLHAGCIKGAANNPVRGIKFVRCRVTAGEPLQLLYAEDVDFSGMTWKLKD